MSLSKLLFKEFVCSSLTWQQRCGPLRRLERDCTWQHGVAHEVPLMYASGLDGLVLTSDIILAFQKIGLSNLKNLNRVKREIHIEQSL